MKRIFKVILMVAVLPAYTHTEAADTNIKTLVDGNNKFAIELYTNLKTQEGNLIFSPYSISTALAMTYAGARGNTEAQMAKVLHFDSLTQEQLHPEFKNLIDRTQSKTKNYQLNVANALWGQKGYGFLQEFLELTKKNYGAGFNEVDFIEATENARQTINIWVEKQTKNKIKELIRPGFLNPDVRLVLTNAIYFKGDWASKFDKKETKDSPFYVKPDKKVKVPMMFKESEFKFMETDKFKAIELPYKGNELSMIVLLPEKIDGIAELENSLTSDSLFIWMNQLESRKVKVYFPQFKNTLEFSLEKTLADMGMPDAFCSSADFSGMNGRQTLFISAVIHKAFIDIKEEGTEAAAATAVIMEECISIVPRRQRVPIFRADHPFIFLIRDNRSGSILFLGRVVNPAG